MMNKVLRCAVLAVLLAAITTTVYAVSMQMDVSRELNKQDKKVELDQRVNQAIMLINNQEFYRALSVVRQMGVEFPDEAIVSVLEGLSYEGLQQPEKAVEAFEHAIARDPNESRAYARLGRIYYLMLEEPEKAKEYLYKAIELNATDMDSHRILTYIMLDEGDEDAAIEHIKKSIINTQNIDERVVVASYYLDRKEYDKCIDVCKDVLIDDSESKEARNVMAQAYLAQDENEKAIDVFKGTLEQFPQEYTVYIALAQTYARVGKEDEQVDILNKAKRIQPDNALSYFLLGEYYINKQNYDKALYELREAEQRDPNNPELKSRIAMVYQLLNEPEKSLEICEALRKSNGFVLQNEVMIAFNLRKLKKYDEAEKVFRNILDKDAKNAQVLINLADMYNEQGKLDEAKTYYEKIIPLKAGDIIEHDAYYKLANILRVQNEMVKAEILLKEGCERFPASPMMPLALANIQLSMKNFDEAKKLYEEGSEKHPDEPNYLYGLGVTYLFQKEYDKAAEYFEKVIDLVPTHLDSLSRLASIYIMQDKKDEAFDLLREKQAESPDNIDLMLMLAKFLSDDNKAEEAETFYKQAVKLAPKNPNVLFTVSAFYMAQGKNDQAIDYLQKVIDIDTTSPEPYFRLGLLYEQQGDTEKAMETYRKGLAVNDTHPFMLNNLAWLLASKKNEMDEAARLAGRANELMPSNGPIMDTLGWILYMQGTDTKKAFELVKESEERAPNVPSIQYHLGKMYFDQGKTEEAKKHLDKALEVAGEGPFSERQDVLDLLNKIK